MITIHSKFLKSVTLFLSALFVSMGFPGNHFPTLGIALIIPFSLVPLFLTVLTLPRKYSDQTRIKPHLIIISANQRALHAFIAIWFFGFVVQLLAFYWISQPIIYFSTFKPIIAYPIYVVICLLTSLYFPFLFSPLILQIWLKTRDPNKNLSLLAIAMTMTLFEMIAPRFFNWSFGSLMHEYSYLNQLSSYFGFNINSFFIFFTSLVLSHSIIEFSKNKSKIISSISLVFVIWSAIFTFGYFHIKFMDEKLKVKKTTRVAFIQPNFTFNSIASMPLPSKSSQKQNLNTLLEMTHSIIEKALEKDGKKPDLVIWPESATHSFFTLDKKEIELTKELAAVRQVPILVQSTRWDLNEVKAFGFEKAKVWSTSFLIRPDGSKSINYEKWVPIPFGEYVPLEAYFPKIGELFRKIFANSSKVEIGSSYDALAYTSKEFAAPLICFDSINPEVPRLETLKGKASILVNQANFVWMVKSNAGIEFSVLNQFRAIENSRSLIMVSNTGPSMAFDPLGRVILKPTELLTVASGYVDLPVSEEKTLFSILSNWPLIIIGCISFVWLLFTAVKNRHDF